LSIPRAIGTCFSSASCPRSVPGADHASSSGELVTHPILQVIVLMIFLRRIERAGSNDLLINRRLEHGWMSCQKASRSSLVLTLAGAELFGTNPSSFKWKASRFVWPAGRGGRGFPLPLGFSAVFFNLDPSDVTAAVYRCARLCTWVVECAFAAKGERGVDRSRIRR
jgi:hypothetical protein